MGSIVEFNKKFNHIFVTGDIHADFLLLKNRVEKIPNPSKDDLLIILGDCGFFFHKFYGNIERDYFFQDHVAQLPITVLALQGNHEVPYKEMGLEHIRLFGGDGYESHGIYFADNGSELMVEVLQGSDESKRLELSCENGVIGSTHGNNLIHGTDCVVEKKRRGTVKSYKKLKFLVIGGAYSVDKEYRLMRHYPYWEAEELSDSEFLSIRNNVAGKKYDYVLTHTCPYSYMPTEVFLSWVDQSKVSNKTEKELDIIKGSIEYKRWFCGHFHTDKVQDDIVFMFNDVRQI